MVLLYKNITIALLYRKIFGSPEQSSDGLKKPVRSQRPNRFMTTKYLCNDANLFYIHQ